MQNFFAKLHQKPDHHKKRFALLASSTITLFIFGFWSVATFGGSGGVLADVDTESQTASVIASENEVGPFKSLRSSLGGSISAIAESFAELMDSFNSVNFQSDYSEMRDKAIESYEQ